MGSHEPPVRSLESLRRDLEEIDRAIVLLLAARIEAACSAIRLRSEQGEPITNPDQESRVLERAERWAQEVGLSPALAETVFRAVVGAGKMHFLVSGGPSRVVASRSQGPARSRSTVAAHRSKAGASSRSESVPT